MTTSPEPRTGRRDVLRWCALYLMMCAVCGLLGGAFWASAVDLPTYHVLPDGRASTTERGLANFFAADAWFSVTGLLIGLGLGLVAWHWLRAMGWRYVLVATLGSLSAAACALGFGILLGPGPFKVRLAAAAPGQDIPIGLGISAWSVFAVWPFAAMFPIVLLSSFLPDPADKLDSTRPSP